MALRSAEESVKVSPRVEDASTETGFLMWFVWYEDGTSVRFPYTAYGLKDAEKFIAMKKELGEVM